MRKWLAAKRKEKGMTQAETAAAAGISQSYYAEIESGARGSSLRVALAKRIAQVLGFDWHLFFADAN